MRRGPVDPMAGRAATVFSRAHLQSHRKADARDAQALADTLRALTEGHRYPESAGPPLGSQRQKEEGP